MHRAATFCLAVVAAGSVLLGGTGGEMPFTATLGAADSLVPVLQESLRSIWNQILAPSGGTLHWVYLLVAFAICYGIYRWERRSGAAVSSSLGSTGGRRQPPTSFRGFLFPGGFLGNRSVRLDLFFFLTTMAIGTIGAFYLIYWSFDGMRTAVVAALDWVLPRPHLEPTLFLRLVFSLLIVLTVDLQLYLVHWLLHNTKVGWAIHQTHHSQRELNIFTDDREHPIYPLVQHLVPAWWPFRSQSPSSLRPACSRSRWLTWGSVSSCTG